METNNQDSNFELLKKLALETETKTAGEETAVLGSDFFEPEKQTPPLTGKTDTTNTEEKTPSAETNDAEATPASTKKISKDVKEASARTAVGMLDFTQKLLITPVLNIRFKKKFTTQEVERLNNGVEDANKSDLDNDDLKLRNKWDRLLKKHTQKLESIPLTPTEENDLHKAFYNYMDIKEKTLPPEYFLGLTILTVIGKRAIDAFTD